MAILDSGQQFFWSFDRFCKNVINIFKEAFGINLGLARFEHRGYTSRRPNILRNGKA